MKIAVGQENAERQRIGQLKLRSLFALMAMIGIYLAWHRQFGHLHEHNESPAFVTIPSLGLPLAIFLSGIFPKLREATYVVGAALIPILCVNCTLTTANTLMHSVRSTPPMTQYTIYGSQILWGSFLWGFALPAIATVVVVAMETERREFKRNSFSFSSCILSIISTTVANLFAILLFTSRVRDIDVFANWLRRVLGIDD